MGNFGGHALPGSFFILFALWWTVQMFHRYYNCRQRNTRFVSTPTYPCTCLCGKLAEWPLEPVVKIFFVTIGFCLEIYTGFSDGKFTALGNGQHATMFFFFGLTGVIDLLLYFRAPVPKDLDYASMWLALLVEGLLFKFHLHGRNELDVLLHTLLIYTIGANLLALLAETKWRNNILISLTRSYFIFLQGTWFWQVAFILYNPSPAAEQWNPEDHDSLMIATMFFTWHCGAVFLTMLAIGGFVACYHKRFKDFNENEMAMKRLIHTGANGQTMISMNDDSDSEVEFQKPSMGQ
ncbi:transmembrane protein 45B-like [Pecten maximus]|uniref:transmembrane protein 45B-like n=1 Tax=Pecten maximus TaxID=6579 RepID=UPI0014590DCA|nr:transmembrane protein 45B-like [Pecten maximus]